MFVYIYRRMDWTPSPNGTRLANNLSTEFFKTYTMINVVKGSLTKGRVLWPIKSYNQLT
jgi:hypothetical protein